MKEGALLMAVGLLFMGGCSTLDYYAQSIGGHLGLMSKRRDIDAVVRDETTPEELRLKLERASAMRDFASRELALPEGGSYRSYVDLDRPYVVWNVVATPELSLKPKTWCFPVAGCVSYRGYFDEADARVYAEELAGEDLDVYVTGARAYSTLGWFDDPLLSTIVHDKEYRLAGVIFHELAHERLYVPGDSTFNESYAVTVEREGVERWLTENATPELREAYRRDRARREGFLELVLSARGELEQVYASARDDDEKRREKAHIFADLRADYLVLKASWGDFSGYDAWFAKDLNNAKLALIATYNEFVPAFQRILADHHGNMEAFHAACEALAKLPEEERIKTLRAIGREP